MNPIHPEGQRPEGSPESIEVPRRTLIDIGLESGAAITLLALTIGLYLAAEQPSKLLAVPTLIAAILAFDVVSRIRQLKK